MQLESILVFDHEFGSIHQYNKVKSKLSSALLGTSSYIGHISEDNNDFK